MTSRDIATQLVALGCLLMLAACGSNKVKDGPPRSGSAAGQQLPGDPSPRPEAKSRYGNGPVYEVLGKRYTVMHSASGYKERGVASWYGHKFHGNLTSNREVYDMHAMTAAHKTLPLPTYVRVRNLSNGKTVIVRVNDRGPFVHNRIIDLSYSAAKKLDMIGSGTSLVEVEAITFDEQPGVRSATRCGEARRDRSTAGECRDSAACGQRGNGEGLCPGRCIRQPRQRRSAPGPVAERGHRQRIHTRGPVQRQHAVSRAHGTDL